MKNPLGLVSLGISELLIIPLFVAWIWAIVDCLKDSRRSSREKVVWVIALIVFNVLAMCVYWILKLTGRRRAAASAG